MNLLEKQVCLSMFLRLNCLSGAVLALKILFPATGKANNSGANLCNLHSTRASGVELTAYIFIDKSNEITLINSHQKNIFYAKRRSPRRCR
jgi:hypothetical protein